MKKSAWNESQLRRLIRKIVQEELSQVQNTPSKSKNNSSHHFHEDNQFEGLGGFEGFDDFNGFDGFGPSMDEHTAPSTPKARTQPVPSKSNFDPPLDESWAIFGTPEPASPMKTRRVKEERPRALPGWSEPYRPNYSEVESPSTSSRKRKR